MRVGMGILNDPWLNKVRIADGIAQYAEPDDIRQFVRDCMCHPDYRPYIAA